jgi:hypothetical protein
VKNRDLLGNGCKYAKIFKRLSRNLESAVSLLHAIIFFGRWCLSGVQYFVWISQGV